MKTLWVLIYKAKFGDREILDDFISAFTWPFNPDVKIRASHAELGFVDRGESFSFTMRDGEDGARFTDLKHMLRHPDRWEKYVLTVCDDTEQRVHDYCTSELGKKYGIKSLILGFLFKIATTGKKENYCSRGGVAWPLYHIGFLPKRYGVISPRRLVRIMDKCGYKMESV